MVYSGRRTQACQPQSQTSNSRPTTPFQNGSRPRLVHPAAEAAAGGAAGAAGAAWRRAAAARGGEEHLHVWCSRTRKLACSNFRWLSRGDISARSDAQFPSNTTSVELPKAAQQHRQGRATQKNTSQGAVAPTASAHTHRWPRGSAVSRDTEDCAPQPWSAERHEGLTQRGSPFKRRGRTLSPPLPRVPRLGTRHTKGAGASARLTPLAINDGAAT